MAAVSSSAMARAAFPARVYGSNFACVQYSGVFSASTSDEIQMLKLPRNAVVEQVFVAGFVGATVASVQVGDDAGSKTRFGTASLSNAAAMYTAFVGSNYHYSLSDDDRDVTLLLTSAGNTSASGSCSLLMGVWYHMPDGL